MIITNKLCRYNRRRRFRRYIYILWRTIMIDKQEQTRDKIKNYYEDIRDDREL